MSNNVTIKGLNPASTPTSGDALALFQGEPDVGTTNQISILDLGGYIVNNSTVLVNNASTTVPQHLANLASSIQNISIPTTTVIESGSSEIPTADAVYNYCENFITSASIPTGISSIGYNNTASTSLVQERAVASLVTTVASGITTSSTKIPTGKAVAEYINKTTTIADILGTAASITNRVPTIAVVKNLVTTSSADIQNSIDNNNDKKVPTAYAVGQKLNSYALTSALNNYVSTGTITTSLDLTHTSSSSIPTLGAVVTMLNKASTSENSLFKMIRIHPSHYKRLDTTDTLHPFTDQTAAPGLTLKGKYDFYFKTISTDFVENETAANLSDLTTNYIPISLNAFSAEAGTSTTTGGQVGVETARIESLNSTSPGIMRVSVVDRYSTGGNVTVHPFMDVLFVKKNIFS